ncbi:MAG TPA: hypothetical protein DEB24_00395 [Coriobacteriia bacterium]|nr:hypothetical protein [Coriobacteriia bacterium]
MDFRETVIENLAPYRPYYSGDELASLVAIKGDPGVAERENGAAFSGEDGTALDKSFGHLGWGYGSKDTRTWFGILIAPIGKTPLTSSELRLLCEIVDPLIIVALDEAARVALNEAFSSHDGKATTTLERGKQATVFGRKLVSVDGFEQALSDDSEKQRVWAQLKQAGV